MNFLFLEPFFGGSHRDFAEGLRSHSTHTITLHTLPARFWKWRMRGAALFFLKKINSLEDYDGVITTDLMSLSDFKALSGIPDIPTLVYFHENQITYPLAPGESMDFQFGFTDITTALAADRILFNSRTHFDDFFGQLPNFLGMMPEFQPKWVINEIRSKADVLYPGCDLPATLKPSSFLETLPPIIIWNHRWEFDKNPKQFFSALDSIIDSGIEFRLVLMGENFQVVPKEFVAARDRYKDLILHYGYVESKNKYREWLKRGSIVVSTANQENFGISIVEAISCGCLPLVPKRLSYPEIIPKNFHADCLYGSQEELVKKLSFMLSNLSQFQKSRHKLSKAMERYSWRNLIQRYDEELELLAELSTE